MDDIYSKHKHWIKIVQGFGEKEYAEDIVQESYIRVYGKDINFAYFYQVLRTMTYHLHHKKVEKVEITKEIEYSLKEDNTGEEEIKEILKPYIDFINTWDWYDKKMYMLYVTTDVSMRKMAKDSGIPLMNIFQTLKRCKERIKQWQKENQKA